MFQDRVKGQNMEIHTANTVPAMLNDMLWPHLVSLLNRRYSCDHYFKQGSLEAYREMQLLPQKGPLKNNYFLDSP